MQEFKIAKKEKRKYEHILPLILDEEVSLQGLDSDIIYINLRKEGILSACDIIIEKLQDIYGNKNRVTMKQWVATFSVNIPNLEDSGELPTSAPNDYPLLCDWLQEDLIQRLSKGNIPHFEVTEDSRDGETFGIRVSFEWDPSKQALDFGDLGWWEVVEVELYENIYEI